MKKEKRLGILGFHPNSKTDYKNILRIASDEARTISNVLNFIIHEYLTYTGGKLKRLKHKPEAIEEHEASQQTTVSP